MVDRVLANARGDGWIVRGTVAAIRGPWKIQQSGSQVIMAKSFRGTSIGRAAVATLAFAYMVPAAHAAVSFGDTVTCISSGLVTCSAATATINNVSPEFTLSFVGSRQFEVNFLTNGVTITNIGSSNLSSNFAFSFTDRTLPFSAVSIRSTNQVTGFTQDNVSVTGGVLTIRLSSVANGNSWFAKGGSVSLKLESAAPAAVPEPATWALMVAGFGLVGGAVRRRRRATRVAFA